MWKTNRVWVRYIRCGVCPNIWAIFLFINVRRYALRAEFVEFASIFVCFRAARKYVELRTVNERAKKHAPRVCARTSMFEFELNEAKTGLQRFFCHASWMGWAVCVCVFFAFFTGLPNRAKNGANNLETCAMRWICKACFQRYLYAFYSVLLVKLYYFFFWNVFCATWDKVCFYKIILK